MARPIRQLLLTSLICVGAGAARFPAHAAPSEPAKSATAPKTLELGTLFPYLDKYWKLAPGERSRFTMAYYIHQDGKPAPGVKLWLVKGPAREPLPIGADGRVERLPSAADYEAKAQLLVQKPAPGKYGVEMQIQPTARPAVEMDATELAAAIEQTNAGIHRFAGLLGFAAPHMARVLFLGASGGSAVLADGKTTGLPTGPQGPYYEPATLKGAKTLRFAKPPERVLIGPAK